MPTSNTRNSVACSRMIHVNSSSSRMRVPIAKPRPSSARALALRLGQAPDENADEDDVVDAENDLEQRQRGERDPRLGGSEPLHRVTDPESELFFDERVRVVEHLRECRGRQIAADQLAGLGKDRRRTAHADVAAELQCASTGVLHAAPWEFRRRAWRASARALWSAAHQTWSAFVHDSVFGPVRGKNR